MIPRDAHSRRQAAIDAIQEVIAGARACDVESEVIDFKEEADTVGSGGRRITIGPRHEPAARALASEVACMAMSDQGGVIIVGVNDKESGEEALVGSYLDLDWLRGRIHALTQPNFSIDFPEEVFEFGKRLYLLNVHPALTDIRSGGKLRTRIGTRCVELDGDRARRFLERRRSYDWSAEPSPERLSSCDPAALQAGHERYAKRHGLPASSDVELLRQLGVLMDDGEDPQLNNAGALLFCPYESNLERLDICITDVEGAVATERAILKAPMMTAFEEAWQTILRTFSPQPIIVGAQRRDERTIDQLALREALANAIMHRDYRIQHASIIAMMIGDPTDTFKVTSPGDFPEGIDKERLLATSPRRRNPVLADAMNLLGLAERQGIGIKMMHLAMLRDGHLPPEIFAEGGDVVCCLHGGSVNREIRNFFDALTAKDSRFNRDVRSYIAITELLNRTPLRSEALASAAQCSPSEALKVLEHLAALGAVERLLDGTLSFRLTKRSRKALHSRITYRRRTTSDERWDLICAFFDVEDDIGSRDAATLLGVGVSQSSRILRELRDAHKIEPVGSPRGAGVRYRLAS